MRFKSKTRFAIILGFLGALVGCTPAGVKVSTNQFGEWYDYESGYEMPEKPKVKPNKATLDTYLKRYIDEQSRFLGFKVKAAKNPSDLSFELREEPYISKQLEKTSLLSYLLFEDGKVVVDELTSLERFGNQVNNNTPLPSRSVGKTLTSYMLGHAICAGVIESVESRLDDWPELRGTVYENQRLIDLLNMRAGDQKYAYQNQVFLPTQVGVRHRPLSYHFDGMRGQPRGDAYYNYNDLAVNTVTNYINFKTGYKFREFAADVLQNKIGIGSDFYYLAVDNRRAPDNGVKGDGVYISNFSASRYDFLRIARSMLNDWQSDTCEGRYLKEIYAKRERKDRPDANFQRDLRAHNWPNHMYNSYAGYFHTDLYSAPERRIMAMDGFGGQIIVIDFDEGRIVVTNAIYNDFDWKRIVRDVIKDGEL